MAKLPAPIQEKTTDENTGRFPQVWIRWFNQITDLLENLVNSGILSVNGILPDGMGNVEVEADDIPYDNTVSGLAATDVQDAIDETIITASFVIPSFLWSTDTTATDPTTGYIKVNDANLDLATELYVNADTLNGFDYSAVVADMREGDRALIAQFLAEFNNVIYLITGDITDNGGWFTIPVSSESSNGGFVNNAQLNLNYKATAGRDAATTDYDNSASGLSADNTQDAIDELAVNAPFPYFYDSYSSISTISTNSNFNSSPVTIITDTVVLDNAGIYLFEVTGFGGSSVTNRRLAIDFEIDSASVLTAPFEKESKDSNDNYSWQIRTEQNLAAGSYDIDLTFGRLGGGGGSAVYVQDVWITIKRMA